MFGEHPCTRCAPGLMPVLGTGQPPRQMRALQGAHSPGQGETDGANHSELSVMQPQKGHELSSADSFGWGSGRAS